MQYVKLGSSGLDVSRICLGCMSFGIPDTGTHSWTLDEEASRSLIQRALDAGICMRAAAPAHIDDETAEAERRLWCQRIAVDAFTHGVEGRRRSDE